MFTHRMCRRTQLIPCSCCVQQQFLGKILCQQMDFFCVGGRQCHTHHIHVALLTLGVHAPEGYCSCPVCVCVCVCHAGANLWTGASRHLTEDARGLSGTFFTK